MSGFIAFLGSLVCLLILLIFWQDLRRVRSRVPNRRFLMIILSVVAVAAVTGTLLLIMNGGTFLLVYVLLTWPVTGWIAWRAAQARPPSDPDRPPS